jgi:hypothetical protein
LPIRFNCAAKVHIALNRYCKNAMTQENDMLGK